MHAEYVLDGAGGRGGGGSSMPAHTQTTQSHPQPVGPGEKNLPDQIKPKHKQNLSISSGNWQYFTSTAVDGILKRGLLRVGLYTPFIPFSPLTDIKNKFLCHNKTQ